MAEVTVYTRQLCGYCTAAKNLLSSKGVDFVEYDATFEPDLRKQMIQRANGASTFPQIFFGDMHVGGCDDLMALDRSGKLDATLKSAGAA
ncbi:MAG: glutaredoxin 3 [Pseudomonadota bacterium]